VHLPIGNPFRFRQAILGPVRLFEEKQLVRRRLVEDVAQPLVAGSQLNLHTREATRRDFDALHLVPRHRVANGLEARVAPHQKQRKNIQSVWRAPAHVVSKKRGKSILWNDALRKRHAAVRFAVEVGVRLQSAIDQKRARHATRFGTRRRHLHERTRIAPHVHARHLVVRVDSCRDVAHVVELQDIVSVATRPIGFHMQVGGPRLLHEDEQRGPVVQRAVAPPRDLVRCELGGAVVPDRVVPPTGIRLAARLGGERRRQERTTLVRRGHRQHRHQEQTWKHT
jgi:hypothetical protein